MRKINSAKYTPSRTLVLRCIGDSLTRNTGYGHLAQQYYPEMLAVNLRALRVPVRGSNCGISGQTTTGMVARKTILTDDVVPAVAVVWGGHNDAGSSIPTATTTANLITLATQVLASIATSRVVICSTHLQNWATGGEGASPTPPVGTRLNLWNAQHDTYSTLAATYASRVAWCDLYAYLYAVLLADPSKIGVDTYWHEAVGDTHLNPTGQQFVANALLATIQAQSGWLAAMQV